MKTTMQHMMQTKAFKTCNLLELKRKMYGYRKSGVLFFTKDLISLCQDEWFDVYFYVTPSTYGPNNAFPVPRDLFKRVHNEEGKFELIRNYYFDYYQMELTKELYEEYKKNKPFHGLEYIWYHRVNAETFG